MNSNYATADFFGLGIAPGILDILDRLKFKSPTPIQHKAIPLGISGKDVVGIAQTGTGKTIAFGIPMIQSLTRQNGSGLIIVPTRELAIQVNDTLKQFTHKFKMNTAVMIGGESKLRQLDALRKRPRIYIATPGRLLDMISSQHLRIDDVVCLVLDEADRMLDMGFEPQINRIVKMIHEERQTLLFSATISPEIMKIASAYMKLPVHIEIAPSGTAAEKVSQEIFIVQNTAKMKLLRELLREYKGPVLVFTRTKRGAGKVAHALRNMHHSVAEIHSDRSLPQRRAALEGFKSGLYRILIATDIVSRGIDVIGIELVINFDLPDDPENYVHRIGRTGRAGSAGHAISFAMPDQKKDVQSIEKIIKSNIMLSKHPRMPEERFVDSKNNFFSFFKKQKNKKHFFSHKKRTQDWKRRGHR
ncbi:MAG: DEAD/DEAH box helicase [Endomicrobiales bacterium]|nr:DEAD/DEAH box helicase [Endomicrobiales bacterium]